VTGIRDVEGWESAEILKVISDLLQVVGAARRRIVAKLTDRRGNELEFATDRFDMSVAKNSRVIETFSVRGGKRSLSLAGRQGG
jgi:hypothetical protein